MPSSEISVIYILAGTVLGGLISLAVQWQKHRHDIHNIREEHRTEFMAERTAHRLLGHKGYTDRTFIAVKESLGGFEDDELRKILVRAGAVRVKRSDGEERWCLIERENERIDKLSARNSKD